MTAMLQIVPVAAETLSTRARAPWPVLEGGRSEAADPIAAVLQGIGKVVKFNRNAQVFNEGDPARHVYKVISGAVRTCRVLMDGRRQIADFYLPGDFFGLDWQSEHGFTAEAIADAVVVSYPRAQLEAAAESEPALQKLLMNLLAKGLSATQNHVVMLGRQTAQERLAWFLLRIMQRSDDNPNLDLPMSRLDIADYLGLTIETVSRGISQFKRNQLIAVSGAHQVVLKDVEALESLASGEGEL
ncbi:helix-turn-helix domain-containing protein [Dongia sp.]|uniref:helix-turn-helix domain-containing protein n=1 Tax=Dongia sp. TaxID=1977262 RepID=UPI003753D3CC